MRSSGSRSPSLFVAVADVEKDKLLAEELRKHLQPLSDAGQLTHWSLDQISPGQKQAQVIEEQCQQADLFLMLLSADFLSSPDCRLVALLARKRESEGLARMFPIILRAVSLEGTPFYKSEQILHNDLPIDQWPDRDQAWTEIINQIHVLITHFPVSLVTNPQMITVQQPVVNVHVHHNPYKGLSAFQPEDADNFFGRDNLINELFTTLKDMLEDDEARLLAVIGPSGVGKSSVVLAGLLPLLETGDMADSEHWVIKPGNSPLKELMTPLTFHLPEVERKKISDDLEAGEKTILHEYIQRIAEKLHVSRIVLVIDQIEELFLPSVSANVRSRFLSLVSTAVKTPHGPLLAVLTLRDDFLYRFMEFPEFFPLIDAHLSKVKPMTKSEMFEAIEKPALNAQVKFDEHLVSDMLLEVQGQASALPMLQFVLEQLFEAREGVQLTRTAYEQIERVTGAVRKQAEETYKRLPDDQHRKWTRFIFLRLITIGTSDANLSSEKQPSSGLVQPGRDHKGVRAAILNLVMALRHLRYFRIRIPGKRVDHGENPAESTLWYEQNVMRKRESQTNLLDMADLLEQPIVRKCIDSFVKARLLTASEVEEVAPATPEVTHVPTIEVSHEVVLREWPLLKDWISENPHDLRLQQNLAHAIGEWERHQEASEWLYRGRRLREAEKWAQHNRPMKRERTFLQASRKQARASLLPTILLSLLVLVIIGASIGVVQWWRVTHLPVPNHVTNMQDDGEGSLRWCLANAQAGSTIIIDPTLKGIITLKDTVTISKPLTVIGPGEHALAVRIQEAGLLIDETGTLSIANLSFTQGGPSTEPIGSITINIADGSTVHLNHVTIAHNHQTGIRNAGTLTLTNSTISDNSPSGLHGPGSGGIDNLSDGTLTITNSTITDNTSSAAPSGVGGILNDGGEMTITNSTITGNASSPHDPIGVGGIYNTGTMTITNSTISNNSAFANADGGGVGGVQNYHGDMTISNSTISSNSIAGNGGAENIKVGGVVSYGGNITISNSTISHNSSTGVGENTIGGVYNSDETMIITNSTISDNSASDAGGVVNNTGTMTIANSTISNNSSSTTAGIKTNAGGSTMLVFCTITENTGQGILVSSTAKDRPGRITMQDTLLLSTPIVIDNPYSVFQSNGYNLADAVNASFFEQTGDRIIQDPSTLFENGDLLAQNGGATRTIQIRVGSQAYDAIPLQVCQIQAIYDTQNHIYTDQRDQLRPGKGKTQCDIGAYETQQ